MSVLTYIFSEHIKPSMNALLSTKETADRLGVGVSRIQAMIRDKRLPAQKMGRDWFISETDLALVADRKPGRPPKSKEEASEPPAAAATGAAEVATEPKTAKPKKAKPTKKAGAKKGKAA
jgi:excisionase family DNA binding protein